MRNLALQALTEKLGADDVISAEEALELRKAVFPDGVVSREEAEALIALEARVANTDEDWAAAFVEAIVDHVLASGHCQGHVDENNAGWLMVRFGADGARETEVEVLLEVMERAESAPADLAAFTRTRVAALLAGKAICAKETEFVRRALYVAAGAGAVAVTEDEARWLFQIDAESDGRANDPAWTDLFVKAVLNHLMGRRAPAMLDAQGMMARQAWLYAPTAGVGGFLRSMFGSFDDPDRREKVHYREVDAFEAHYERVNQELAQDEKLTLEEIAWAVGMTKADGKRTKNEDALLKAIREIESGAAS